MSKLMKWALGWALVGLGSSLAQAGTFSYVDLVKRLTNLERLASLPAPGEKCMQCSSYDRASRYDKATGKYVAWDANGDGQGFVRREGAQIVMAEMTGPGCIWRIWSARPGNGHVKIYLDGARVPAVDLPFSGYFDGKNAPFVYPSLVYEAAKGWNNYVPIPFQKSCKIVADPNWGNYYHFTYSVFPLGTVMPRFQCELGAAEVAALNAADDYLANQRGTDPAGNRAGQATEQSAVEVAAGQTAVLAHLTGPRAITALRIKVDLADSPDHEQQFAALRELALQIKWDGEQVPSVWAPLGDFFGSAPGINLFKSLPLGMTEDGFYALWYMPFARDARIELVNNGAVARKVQASVTHAPLVGSVLKFGRFHAKWHRDALLPAEKERKIDWTMLKARGPGRFCGVALHVWNPKGGWWGEGDEKFFVDGEKFPSTFGTGSEDYFGYAWGDPGLFEQAFHAQPLSSNNRGHISVDRWHITDSQPFQTSFEGCLEKYFPNTRPCLFACTVYWYQPAGTTDFYPPLPLDQRVGYWTPLQELHIPAALEGEQMKVLSSTGGTTVAQDLGIFGGEKWSGGNQLWWNGAKPGDKLVLALPVEKAGAYEIQMVLTKARDYGIVQLSLDGQKLGEAVDLFNPDVVPAPVMTFPARQLTAGEHQLTVEIVGANGRAEKIFMFGLDYIKLMPVE